MIKITPKDFDRIYPILKIFAKNHPRLQNLDEEEQITQLKQIFNQEGMNLFGIENEKTEITAIALITLHDTYQFAWNISLVLTLLDAESKLNQKLIITEAIDYLQQNPEVKIFNIGGNITFEGDTELFLSKGFAKFDRAKMEISQEKILINTQKSKFEEILNQNQLKFIQWNDKYIQSTANLCLDHGQKNLDNTIFPYFLDVECTQKFMTLLLAHKWGKFDPHTSFLLIKEDAPIGVCFVTELQPKRGYIPYIRLLPEYNGLGLGKALLYKSLLSVITTNPDWNFIDLDVTYGNIALNLYTSLGFEKTREYFLWNFRK